MKTSKCDAGEVDPIKICFAIPAGVHWNGTETCTKSVAGNPAIVPFVIVDHDVESLKKTIPPGDYEFEIGIRWNEIDDRTRTWSIPGSRTKNKKAHLVHLSEQAWRVVATCPAG